MAMEMQPHPVMTPIKVYGADWCPMTERTVAHLEELAVPFEYIDIQDDPAARKWVMEQNDGKEKKPTVQIGERVIAEPSNEELDQILRAEGSLV